MSQSETVKIGFSIPATVEVEVDEPEDADAVIEEFVERIDEMSSQELLDSMSSQEGYWLSENVHYVDTLDGDVIHQW